MVNMARDRHFPMAAALEVLEAIPGPAHGRMGPGPRAAPPPSRSSDLTAFFARVLA